MSAIALCGQGGCESDRFQVVVTDLDETVRCADCRAVRFRVAAWITVLGNGRDRSDGDFEDVRAAMLRQALANEADRGRRLGQQ